MLYCLSLLTAEQYTNTIIHHAGYSTSELWQPITLFHSAHCFPTEWSFNASAVSTAVLPNLKQKMMYTYSSWKSVNPQRSRNCRAHNTKSQCTVTHARTLKSTENDTTTLTPHSRWVLYQVQYCSNVLYWPVQKFLITLHTWCHNPKDCNIHSHCLQKLNGTLKYLSFYIITKSQESLQLEFNIIVNNKSLLNHLLLWVLLRFIIK